MKLIRFLMVVLVLLLVESAASAASWYPGIIHVHSTFSDGDRTPAMLKLEATQRGMYFLVVTDHLEQIDSKKKLTRGITGDYGYDKYFQTFDCHNMNNPKVRGTDRSLICVPGAEVTGGEAHILMMNIIGDPSKFLGNSQKEVVDRITNYECTSAVAHPNLSGHIFRIDEGNAYKIIGIELFNDDYRKTLALLLSELAKGHYHFVFSGCDSHIAAQPEDARRWMRITLVWVDGEPTVDAILSALHGGRMVATNYGVYVKSLSPLPQFATRQVEKAQFNLVVGFAVPVITPKKIQVYRDGILCPSSSLKIPTGTTEYRYRWEDRNSLIGEHWYVIEVEECLVTSPITLEVPNAAGDPAVSFFTKMGVCLGMKDSPGLRLSGSSYYCNIDLYSGKHYQNLFQAPARLEVETVFTNRRARGKAEMLYGYVLVYNQKNQLVAQERLAIKTFIDWQTAGSGTLVDLIEKGTYRIEVRDQTKQILLGQKTITIY